MSQSQLEEETVAREIAEKLGYTSGISYSEIASTASEYGRKKLAIKVFMGYFICHFTDFNKFVAVRL